VRAGVCSGHILEVGACPGTRCGEGRRCPVTEEESDVCILPEFGYLEPRLLEFLLSTCVTERICGGLATALTDIGSSRSVLEEIAVLEQSH
jgi:hypothetical protein